MKFEKDALEAFIAANRSAASQGVASAANAQLKKEKRIEKEMLIAVNKSAANARTEKQDLLVADAAAQAAANVTSNMAIKAMIL